MTRPKHRVWASPTMKPMATVSDPSGLTFHGARWAIAASDGLTLHPRATYFVGENGTGKSTLLEGIAVAAGFNPEGGSINFRFATRSSESSLGTALRLVRSAPDGSDLTAGA